MRCGMIRDILKNFTNFFETFKSNDKYDREAITHVMHCNALLPGVLIKQQNIYRS